MGSWSRSPIFWPWSSLTWLSALRGPFGQTLFAHRKPKPLHVPEKLASLEGHIQRAPENVARFAAFSGPIGRMVDPKKNEGPSAEEGLNRLVESILGPSTENTLFTSRCSGFPSFRSPISGNSSDSASPTFPQKRPEPGAPRLLPRLETKEFFIKNVDLEYFFDTLRKIMSEYSIFSRQKNRESGADSPERSLQTVSKGFPAKMDSFPRDRTMLSFAEADRNSCPGSTSTSHVVVKPNYHSLFLQNVISTLECVKRRVTYSTPARAAAGVPGFPGNY